MTWFICSLVDFFELHILRTLTKRIAFRIAYRIKIFGWGYYKKREIQTNAM